uniref:Putative site-specific DNA endonuclease n=1 Tax=Tupiella akineta TaxID=160070 RepID=Q3ZJ42_TUPAK|nr:putative site-specific DNA endonuclease [Tupiella akineta]AAV80647.1 putative site-specific DNA endonuclease [Tupiella akineta]
MDVSSVFTAGIYGIRCLKNNKFYIGELANLLSRLGRHSDDLQNNRHDCFELQQDFNKYSKTDFVFKVLEFGSEFQIKKKRKISENEYIIKIKPLFRYNKPKNQSWNFYSQKVLIKGTVYQSLREAAIGLKESRTNLMRKLGDLKNLDYQLLETTGYKKRSIACQITNVKYLMLSEAAKTLKQSPTTIKKKCKSEEYPNSIFLNENDRSNDYP